MKNWNQADYDERKQRQNDGQADDDDRRLIKLYEQEGFEQSRLTREREAKQAAARGPAGATEPSDDDGNDDGTPARLNSRSKVEDWRAFAEQVNERLEPGERPVVDPGKASKDDLVAGYRHYAAQAQSSAS